MKKLIKLTIIFIIILSLTFIPTFQTNAASKVNITYYAGKGHFKAKPNRSKNKITIKNKLNKKRGYSPAIRRDGYTFDGWYTKKKGGKKYSASTIITKNQKLYPHWLKKYKVNNNYFIPLGTTYPNLSDYEPYWGTLKILKKKKGSYSYDYTLINEKQDYFYVTSNVNALDDNGNFLYDYGFSSLNCKLKNLININKATNFKIFLRKLGVKYYNYDSNSKFLDFICCKTYYASEHKYIDVVWQIYLDKKNQIFPNTNVSFVLTDDWKRY